MNTDERMEKIRQRAEAKGVAMTHLCGLAGLNYASWYRWTKGKQKPRDGTLDRLEAQLDKIKKGKPS